MLYKYFLRHHDDGEAWKDSKQNDRYTASSILSKSLSDSQKISAIRAFRNNWDTRKTENGFADVYNPPKLHENSVLVYHGANHANMAVNMRTYDPFLLFGPLILYPLPQYTIVGMSLIYLIWMRAFIFEPSRRIVLWLDLLPHIESVSIMKVGNFGGLYNEIVPIADFEKINREDDWEKHNHIWEMHKIQLDWDMTFRNKTTGEYYYFEELGKWDYNGVNHSLLN